MRAPAAGGVRTARLSDTALPELVLPPPWPASTVRLDAGPIHTRVTPGRSGGEPALYVHGLGGSSTNWTDLAGLLAGYLSGEALDLPGFGHSPPPARGRYGLGAHSRAVIELLDYRGRGPVHLFGNSLGGAVALRVAAQRPDLVRTLTLVSPAMPDLRPRGASDPTLPLLLVPGLSTVAVRRLATVPPERRARAMINLCFADPSIVPAKRLAEAVEEMQHRADLPYATAALMRSLRGLAGAYLVPPRRGLWHQASLVQAPTLVIWGNRDRLVSVRLAERTAAAIPDSRLLVLPDVGHTAQLERPQTVARAFLGMLEDLALPTARNTRCPRHLSGDTGP